MRKHTSVTLAVGCLCVALLTAPRPCLAGPAATTRVSVSSDGAESDAACEEPAISADGRYVAFYSKSSNLVPGDTNQDGDVFLHDRQTGKTIRVSVSSDGAQATGQSRYASISADARYVAFSSSAPDLVAGDTNGKSDVFVRDIQEGKTIRVSVSSDGAEGDFASKKSVISADGGCVAFYSKAGNLVPGDTNRTNDVFVHDPKTGKTTRVSVATDGTQGNGESSTCSTSADGRYIAFQSDASNLVEGDTNGKTDILVHDRETGKTVRASAASDGAQGDDVSLSPAMSGDGRYVLFQSGASGLVPGDTNGQCDIFMHDLKTGKTIRISVTGDGAQGDGESRQVVISADNRYAAFQSRATNLVPGDTNGMKDVFLRDQKTGEMVMISVASDGALGNASSSQAAISGDGRCIAFRAAANNLAPGDTNGKSDIFVRDLADRAGAADKPKADGATPVRP